MMQSGCPLSGVALASQRASDSLVLGDGHGFRRGGLTFKFCPWQTTELIKAHSSLREFRFNKARCVGKGIGLDVVVGGRVFKYPKIDEK